MPSTTDTSAKHVPDRVTVLGDRSSKAGSTSETRSSKFTPTCEKCTNGNKVTVAFPEGAFVFHSQWLHDARCDGGAARNASTAICQQPPGAVRVKSVKMSGQGSRATVDITWDDEVSSKFPLAWLRVMAPLVAAKTQSPSLATTKPAEETKDKGWSVQSLNIPEVSYNDLFKPDVPEQESDAIVLSTIDKILSPSFPGIIKVVDLPEPNLEEEHKHVNNLITHVLKHLFGSVFVHPIRGPDQTFNVSSHDHDSTRKIGLPNYDTNQVLLPHTDHAFYTHPIQVMGFYGLQGTSINTWTSPLAALETLTQESPDSYHHLCNAPMALGRVSHFYDGVPLYQATVDTPITLQPGTTDQVKRFRWHPNLTGSLLAPYDRYHETRLAHRRFQEILRRDTQQLKTALRPGDMYVWDNFRLMHGRETVLDTPRTGLGQTVPEQVVQDRYRALCTARLRDDVDAQWLVHMPMPQLRELLQIYEKGCFGIDG